MIRSFGGKSPRIHPTAFVSEAAYVVGDVEVGEGSSVWPGTIIRGNVHKIRLGKYVDLQDNCVVHTDSDATYGDYVTLGHHVICHAKTVEEHCLIGNGAVINGEVIIGHHSIVASGSIILERVEIPPYSFVTGLVRAAQDVQRKVNDRHLQMIKGTAEGYYRNGQQFKEAGLQDPDQGKFTDPTV
ncbi:MAG: gamma carbonic anhydrase family protein [Dehalococcoidia bacterium]|nr:gamma carbonic anhydrase family protein [Dehalococcoidia bacterium]